MFARQRRSPRTTSAGRTLLRLEGLEDRWVPASPIVTNTNDAGAGSLRAAVATINNNGNPDPANTITFQLTDGPTWDINLETELILNANVTITGPDIAGVPALTILGWKAGEGFLLVGSRVFTVGEGRSVNLLKLELMDGAAPFTDPNGGLIKVLTSGNLIVRNSTLWGGSAWHDGGGIWGGTGSRITVTDSVIRNNKAGENGGGIAFSGETLTIQTTGGTALPSLSLYPTRLVYNEAGLDGGGVWVSGTGNANEPKVTLSKVSVNGNIAGESGGGLFLKWSPTATGVPVELTDVCLRGNEALRNFAGGIFVNAKTRMIRGQSFRTRRASRKLRSTTPENDSSRWVTSRSTGTSKPKPSSLQIRPTRSRRRRSTSDPTRKPSCAKRRSTPTELVPRTSGTTAGWRSAIPKTPAASAGPSSSATTRSLPPAASASTWIVLRPTSSRFPALATR